MTPLVYGLRTSEFPQCWMGEKWTNGLSQGRGEGGVKTRFSWSSLPAPRLHWAILVSGVSITAMAVSGLGPRGLHPRVSLPTEAKGRNGYVLTPRPTCTHGNGIGKLKHAHSQQPWVKRGLLVECALKVFHFEKALKPASRGSLFQWLPGLLSGR